MERKLSILFENVDFLVINKPAGLLVHPYSVSGGEKTTEGTLATLLLERYPNLNQVGDDPVNRPGIVHRLDRETSGVLLVAKTQEAFEHFKKQFQNHSITKEYEAIVHGVPEPLQGVVDKPIGLKNGTVKRTVHGGRMVKTAITEYHVEKADSLYALIKVIPKTGRTHQIRVHLSSIGHPLVGDKVYGTSTTRKEDIRNKIERCMLHALSITCVTRDGQRMRFEATPPDDFQTTWNKLSTP